MASMFAEYVREITNDEIIETDKGFVTYTFLGNETVYIKDIYVPERYRKLRIASDLADMVVAIAKEKGCKEVIGTVRPENKNSSRSAKVLMAYGMRMSHIWGEFVVFKKEIVWPL